MLLAFAFGVFCVLFVLSGIKRVRRKLDPSKTPSLWAYVNELGGYIFVGLLLGVATVTWIYHSVFSLDLEIIRAEHKLNLVGNNQSRITVKNSSGNSGDFELTVTSRPNAKSETTTGEWKSIFNIGANQTQTYTIDLPGNSVFDAESMQAEARPR